MGRTPLGRLSFLLPWLCLMLAGVAAAGQAGEALAAEPGASFERAYAPVVRERCLTCHGDRKPKAGLNLGRRELVLLPAVEGEDPVVLPRKPKESRLLKRVIDGSMPPEDEGPPLSAKEIALLRAWIEAGADWPAGRVLEAEGEGPETSKKGPERKGEQRRSGGASNSLR